VHIAIFEPRPEGHHYTYIKRLLPAVADLGQQVTLVTSPEGVASPEYHAEIQSLEHLCAVDTSISLNRSGHKVGNFWGLATDLRRIAVDLAADHVLVPYADGMIQMVGFGSITGRFSRLPGVEFEGLMMRGSFAYQRPTLREAVRARTWLALTAAAPFRVVHHTDPIVVGALKRRAPGLSRRTRLIPDPVERFDPIARDEARRRLGIREDGRYIGCVGIMDRRKGIDRLIRAFVAARLGAADRLLLAGKQEPAIRELLAAEAADAVRDGRIVALERYISDEEFCLSVAAMDVVCTPYPPEGGHSGSSSIVVHAAGQGRPVLGSAFGWIGDTIQRFGLGRVADVTDTAAFARAISASIGAADEYRITEGGRRFAEFHRPDNFAACFTRRLRERLGLPAHTGLRTWDWVLEAAAEPAQPALDRSRTTARPG
jgi:hypothetical protein